VAYGVWNMKAPYAKVIRPLVPGKGSWDTTGSRDQAPRSQRAPGTLLSPGSLLRMALFLSRRRSCLWQNGAVWYLPSCHECLKIRHRTTTETVGEVQAYRGFVCSRLVNKLEYHTLKRAVNSVVTLRLERSRVTSLIARENVLWQG
jgi:hypothetical protein